jgi:hypothetical protein
MHPPSQMCSVKLTLLKMGGIKIQRKSIESLSQPPQYNDKFVTFTYVSCGTDKSCILLIHSNKNYQALIEPYYYINHKFFYKDYGVTNII